jgi:hypothetical protein
METELRSWSCRHCGRSNKTPLAENGTAECAFCHNVTSVQPSRHRGGEAHRHPPPGSRPKPLAVDTAEASSPEEALRRLRGIYAKTRDLVSTDEPHGNLEWILGARSNADVRALEAKTVELVSLWLHDLAREIDPPALRPGRTEHAHRDHQLRRSAARSLRDATKALLVAVAPLPTGGPKVAPQPAS